MIVAAFFMSPLVRTDVKRSAAFRNWSRGIPVIRSTMSGVYRENCSLSSWKTQRGCCSVGSYATLGGSEGGVGLADPPGAAPPAPACAPAGPNAAYPRPVNGCETCTVDGAPLGAGAGTLDSAERPPPLAVPFAAAATCCAV